MEVEYDSRKAATNLRKHGISFKEASSCFYDQLALAMEDSHSESEYRWILIGLSRRQRYLTVVYTLRENIVRIISARKSTRREKRDYAKRV